MLVALATMISLWITCTPAFQSTVSASEKVIEATYVALGDSYSAGEGLGPFQQGTDVKKGTHRNQCHRSEQFAYPDLTSTVLPQVESRAFWACSGATSLDMEHEPPQSGKAEQYAQPAQVNTVGASTRWISLTAGGDDLNFGGIGTSCVVAVLDHKKTLRFGSPDCASQLTAQEARRATLQKDLEKLYEVLLARASSADLVVAGYPAIFPPTYSNTPTFNGIPYCVLDHYGFLFPHTVDVGLPVSNAILVSSFITQLNTTVQDAVKTVQADVPADSGRIRYADVEGTSISHNCRGTTPNASVTGFELSLLHGVGPWYKSFTSSGSFHPTKAGQQVYAEAVERAFQMFVPVTTLPQTHSFAPGAHFDDYCVIAWPTAPTYTSTSIQMTMSCEDVPEGQYLFTDVVYNDPSLQPTPSTGRMHVVGTVIDVAAPTMGSPS